MEIYSKCADTEMEKERVQRHRNWDMNNVAFYAVSLSSQYGYLCPKLKTQKSPDSNTEHKTSVYKTQCHI